MMYVEWLRVRNCLKVLGIVFGVLILITFALRIGLNGKIGDANAWMIDQVNSPGMVVSHSVLPDGTQRTTLRNDRENKTVTIDPKWYGDLHIVITEPYSEEEDLHLDGSFLSVHSNAVRQGNTRIETIDTDGSTDLAYYAMIASIVALIVATCLAAPFARERDGHLEISLTKPVSRMTYALGTIGVDIAGLFLSAVMTVIALMIVQAMFELPVLGFSGGTGYVLLGTAIFPMAWYALLCAASASLSRGYGAVIGFAWPATLLVVFLGSIKANGDSAPLWQAIHQIFWVVSRVIPLTYLQSFGVDMTHNGAITLQPGYWSNTLIVLCLFIIYSGLAVFQWRRAEA